MTLYLSPTGWDIARWELDEQLADTAEVSWDNGATWEPLDVAGNLAQIHVAGPMYANPAGWHVVAADVLPVVRQLGGVERTDEWIRLRPRTPLA